MSDIKTALKKAAAELKECDTQNAMNEALCILSYTQKKDKLYLYAHGELTLSEKEESDFFSLVKKRCEKVPLAYITNEKEFSGLSFYVDGRVLIPRPDTETLAECALAFLMKNASDNPDYLDMCCGSGAVGISVAHKTKTHVWLSDISADALKVCEINAQRYIKGCFSLVQSDLFEAFATLGSAHALLAEKDNTDKSGKNPFYGFFSLISANPPYISAEEYLSLPKDIINNEPKAALLGGEYGIELELKIIGQAHKFLKKGGALMLECGYDQAEKLSGAMSENGYEEIFTQKDLSGIKRVVGGIKK